MAFYNELCDATSAEQSYLLNAPAITSALAGDISHSRYVGFLTQAFYHVEHTVPLLMAAVPVFGASRNGCGPQWLNTLMRSTVTTSGF